MYVDVPGTGPDNRAISLDGANPSGTNFPGSGVNFGAPALFNFTTNSFSVGAWVAVNTDVAQGNNEWICGKDNSAWRIGYTEDGGAKRVSTFTPGSNESAGGELNPAFSFHHLLLAKSLGDRTELYIDGVPQGFTGGSEAIPDNLTNELSAAVGGGNALEMMIDELIIYDERLSELDAKALVAAGPTFTASVTSETAVVGSSMGTEFTSASGLTYSLQFQTSNGWSDTGAFADGDGADIVLFDPSGFSTAKQYRVSVTP